MKCTLLVISADKWVFLFQTWKFTKRNGAQPLTKFCNNKPKKKHTHTKFLFSYQIHKHRRRTNRGCRFRWTRCAHLVRPAHRMGIEPNIPRAVNRAHRSNSSFAGSYRPILHNVCTVSTILVQKEMWENSDMKMRPPKNRQNTLCKWLSPFITNS